MSTDFHVHLELIDPALVAAGGLTRVVDLGSSRPVEVPGVEVIRAGRMLTAPGGYPSDRPWAASGLFREVAAVGAKEAVAEQVADGAALIKIALNADAGPVWDDAVLGEVVAAAHAADRRVVAHVEGVGQAARAGQAGVDAFAHAPWTERLPDALVSDLATRVTWISTLRIHSGADRERALDNVRRFHGAGGRIRYGTDMGNGPCSGGVEQDELDALREAGLGEEELAAAMSGAL
ncbi:MAG: hydrolase [Microbacteriaceae bacterium]|nr:hydrolase [Microbacteriaceae bacterium]